MLRVCSAGPTSATRATASKGTHGCHFISVAEALVAATDHSIVLVEAGHYDETTHYFFASSSLSSTLVTLRAHNVTLRTRGGEVVLGLGGRSLALEGYVFTVEGSLSLVDGGLWVAAGGRLVQKGQLSVIVKAYMAVGVRLAAGATWSQEGRAVITAGSRLRSNDPAALWEQLGALELSSYGAIGVLVSAGAQWNQRGRADVTLAGGTDFCTPARTGPNHGSIFGEGVRLVGGTWRQTAPVLVTAVNASTGVFVAAGSLWLQKDDVAFTLVSTQAGVRLVGSSALWQQGGRASLNITCPKPRCSTPTARFKLCTGVLAPSLVSVRWNQVGPVDIHTSGPETIGVDGAKLQWRSSDTRSVPASSSATTSPADEADHDDNIGSNGDEEDRYWAELATPIYDAVKVMLVAALPPPVTEVARMELYRRLYPGGHALEAVSPDGACYRLCANDGDEGHHYDRHRLYRLRGLRVEGSPCVHARLEELESEADETAATRGWTMPFTNGSRSSHDLVGRALVPEVASMGVRPLILMRTAFKGQLTYFTSIDRLSDIATELETFMRRLSNGRMEMPVRFDRGCLYEMEITHEQSDAANPTIAGFVAYASAAAASHNDPACRIDQNQMAAFKHIMVAVPGSALPYAGLAYIGGSTGVFNGAVGPSTVVHEVGHNLGMPHAGSANTAVDVGHWHYGNPFDVMGSAGFSQMPLQKMSFLAGHQDTMGWMGPDNKVTYPMDAFEDGGVPWVATYSLAGIENDNGLDVLETVRIPMAIATHGHLDSWLYFNWISNSGGVVRRGIMATEESFSFTWTGEPTGVIAVGVLFDAAIGTVTMRDYVINATAPVVYGLGGHAPVLIEVTGLPTTATGSGGSLPVRVTRLRPDGERMEGRGCRRATGCEPSADSVPTQACNTIENYSRRSVIVRVTSTTLQAALIEVEASGPIEVGLFRQHFPVGQLHYGSPPRVNSDDAVAIPNTRRATLESSVNPSEPLWTAASTSSDGDGWIRVSVTCSDTVANTRRRLVFDQAGANTNMITGPFELIGIQEWVKYLHPWGYELRLGYKAAQRSWQMWVYEQHDDDKIMSLWHMVNRQSQSPVEWNGQSLYAGDAVTLVRHACPRGMFAPEVDRCAPCPEFTATYYAGSTSIDACRCLAGYAADGPSGGSCRPCPAGTYSQGNGESCQACPADHTSPPGSPLRSYCQRATKRTVGSRSTVKKRSAAPRSEPAESPPPPSCWRFTLSGMSGPTELAAQFNGFYEWDGNAIAAGEWQPRYRLMSGSALEDTCFMSGWAAEVWAWRSCSTGDYLGYAVLDGSAPNTLDTTRFIYFTPGSEGELYDPGALYMECSYYPSRTPSPSPSPSGSPSYVPRPKWVRIGTAAGEQPLEALADIPLGDYLVTGYTTENGYGALALDGMHFMWHEATRTWGFTERPDLDGTARFAVTDPMPWSLPVGTVAVRLFDPQAFTIPATLMFTVVLEVGSPSAQPLSSSAPPSPLPSPTPTPLSSEPSPSSSPATTPTPSISLSSSSPPSPSGSASRQALVSADPSTSPSISSLSPSHTSTPMTSSDGVSPSPSTTPLAQPSASVSASTISSPSASRTSTPSTSTSPLAASLSPSRSPTSPVTPSPSLSGPSPSSSPSSPRGSTSATASSSPASQSMSPTWSPSSSTAPDGTVAEATSDGFSPIIAAAVAIPVALVVVAVVAVVAAALVWRSRRRRLPAVFRRRSTATGYPNCGGTPLYDMNTAQQVVNDIYAPDATGWTSRPDSA